MNSVKTAIIGCGGIANAHIKGLKLLWESGIKTFEIIAVCDVDEPKAERMSEEISLFQGYKPTVYTDVEKMLSLESQLQAVDICIVHKEHHNVAIKCLEAKKHITIEKPLAITIRAARKILDSAEKNGCILQVAENYRRAPSERAINWAIREGMVGRLRMLYWEDIFERLWYWGWRDHKELAGGGWTLDGGVHFADLFRYHIGEVEELYAISKTYNPVRFRDKDRLLDPIGITVEDTTMALLRFENGVIGSWILTNSAPGKKINFRAIYGDKGCIVWNDGVYRGDERVSMEELEKEFMNNLSIQEKERLFPNGITDTIAIELKEFFDAVLGVGDIETSGVVGLKDEAICMAVYESSLLNLPVKIGDIEECRIENYQNQLIGG